MYLYQFVDIHTHPVSPKKSTGIAESPGARRATSHHWCTFGTNATMSTPT